MKKDNYRVIIFSYKKLKVSCHTVIHSREKNVILQILKTYNFM